MIEIQRTGAASYRIQLDEHLNQWLGSAQARLLDAGIDATPERTLQLLIQHALFNEDEAIAAAQAEWKKAAAAKHRTHAPGADRSDRNTKASERNALVLEALRIRGADGGHVKDLCQTLDGEYSRDAVATSLWSLEQRGSVVGVRENPRRKRYYAQEFAPDKND